MSCGAVGRPGNRSAGYARSLSKEYAAGSEARICRVTKRRASVRCGERNRASEKSLGDRQWRRGDGWRWPSDGCSGRDIAAHIRGRRRDVASKPPSVFETVAGAIAAKILGSERGFNFSGKRSSPFWKACRRAATNLPRKTLRSTALGRK